MKRVVRDRARRDGADHKEASLEHVYEHASKGCGHLDPVGSLRCGHHRRLRREGGSRPAPTVLTDRASPRRSEDHSDPRPGTRTTGDSASRTGSAPIRGPVRRVAVLSQSAREGGQHRRDRPQARGATRVDRRSVGRAVRVVGPREQLESVGTQPLIGSLRNPATSSVQRVVVSRCRCTDPLGAGLHRRTIRDAGRCARSLPSDELVLSVMARPRKNARTKKSKRSWHRGRKETRRWEKADRMFRRVEKRRAS